MGLETLFVIVIVTIAFFGESIFGFGGGLIAIPLLSLMLGVRDAVTLILIFQLSMGILIWKSYKHISWKIALPMTPSIIIATVIGTLLLSKSNVVFLQFFLAITILIFLVKMVWFNTATLGKKENISKATLAGLGGGLFQGLIGTGGPILTMYLSAVIRQKLALRATLIYLFFITSIVRIGISIPQHLFTSRLLSLIFMTMPFFLIAIFIGQRVHEKINEKYYRLGIYILLASSAILLVIKALTA